MTYRKTVGCRICANADLIPIIDLGVQALTGVFPKSQAENEQLTRGPLVLVKCNEASHSAGEPGGGCGLVQLQHSYDLNELYGGHYGYRSGLNQSMVNHLRELVGKAVARVPVEAGDIILDIGSNDGTTLGSYPEKDLTLVGVDPTAERFRQYYPPKAKVISNFFSAESFRRDFGDSKAKIVTAIAMFYDLEDPMDFMRQVREVLDDEGTWTFEQSYLKLMLERNAYDTICHEHLLYYGLRQIKWMTDRTGFKILDVELNDTNGGSFCVTVAKDTSSHAENAGPIEAILVEEEACGLGGLKPFEAFRDRVHEHRQKLIAFFEKAKAAGKSVYGYGASTKGNVVLQFCGVGTEQMTAIAEVNEDKFGAFTPATMIPIVSEADVRAQSPDYMVVLPWHFRENIVQREQAYLAGGGTLVFPLPAIELVTG